MVLIVGSGRSGTSECARILHEVLGVNMGHAFHLGDKFNPKGYYEDREIQSINLSFYMMHLDEVDGKDNPEIWRLWRERFNEFIESKKEPWGVKDPGIADFKSLLNEYLKLNPHIIWCKRDKEETITSLMRFKDKSREEMERIYNQRINNLTEALKGKEYLELECNQPTEDKEEILKKWYNKVYAN